MKKQITILCLFFISFLGHSQFGPNDQLTYLNSSKNICTSENYEYILAIKDYKTIKDLYDVAIYYKNGQQEMRGISSNKNNLNLEGSCVYFYKNGSRMKIANYVNNKLIGKQFEWYKNGNIKSETEIVYNKKNKKETIRIVQYWDENKIQKVVDGEGEMEQQEGDLNATSHGPIKNFVKEGKWEGTSKHPKLTFVEEYANGELISGISSDTLNNKYNYKEIFVNPRPRKGLSHFYDYVQKEIRDPNTIDTWVQRTINLTFIIGIDGKIEDLKVINKDELGLSNDAIQIISQYKGWIPASYRGVTFKLLHSLRIRFE
jgi:antitoxin component YwqK of YwqJK toxin-antitoxin module